MEIDRYLSELIKEKAIPEASLRKLCEKVKEILMEEPNCVPVQAPVTICGDIHGQFHDLLKLFSTGGELPTTSYIFMVFFIELQKKREIMSIADIILLKLLNIYYA